MQRGPVQGCGGGGHPCRDWVHAALTSPPPETTPLHHRDARQSSSQTSSSKGSMVNTPPGRGTSGLGKWAGQRFSRDFSAQTLTRQRQLSLTALPGEPGTTPTPHPTPTAEDGMAGNFPESIQNGSAFLGAFKDPDLVLWTKGFPGNFSNFPSPTSQPLDQQGCR